MTQEGESISKTDHPNSTQLKQGEFMLSYLQALLVNKKLPKGYKLELEEVYTKTAEQTNNFIGKKRAQVRFNIF